MSRPQELTCRELVELLTAYLDGSMPADDVARVDAHLVGCDGCTNALAQLRDTIRVAGTLTEDEVGDPQREELRAVFREWRREAPGPVAAG